MESPMQSPQFPSYSTVKSGADKKKYQLSP